MKKIIFLFLLFCISFSLKSQTTIQGKIISQDDSCALKGVYVCIVNSENYTYTDSTGVFILDYSNYGYSDSVTFYLYGMESRKISIEDIIEDPIIVMIPKKNDFNNGYDEDNNGYDENTIVKKPVIYLYPQSETMIDVKVNFKGEIKNTYPDYGTSWKVLAEPDGTMINQKDKSKHRYLFWDGVNEKNYKIADFKTGFVVKGKNTSKFLDSILTIVGFSDFEKNDFISYWLPQMSSNKYNFIHFMINDECDKIAVLNVNPTPDSEIRVYMFFSPLEKPISIISQVINPIDLKGFVLKEWGGIEHINLN